VTAAPYQAFRQTRARPKKDRHVKRRKTLTARTLTSGAALGLAAVMGIAVVGISGCGSTKTSATADASGVTTLRYQGWTDQVLLPELADNLGFFGGKVKLDWIGNTISDPQDIQSAATGQTDFGGAFAGAVAKLITAGAPITAVINYYGADRQSFTGYYVPDNSPITKPADLLGKKIGVNTLGGQDEADVHDELKKFGFTESQIKTVQLVTLPPPNTADALRRGQLDVAALQGQFQLRALADGGLRPIFTETDEYGPFAGGSMCSATMSSARTRMRCAPSSPASRRRCNGSTTRLTIR
jgi:ABC-type nitrate/sulfonate/bicarbonate transport system substrate-binding protein